METAHSLDILSVGILHEAVLAFSAETSVEQFWTSVVLNSRWVVPAKRACILLPTSRETLAVAARMDHGRPLPPLPGTFAVGDDTVRTVMRGARPRWIHQPWRDIGTVDILRRWLGVDEQSVVYVAPLMGSKGSVGVILFEFDESYQERPRVAALATLYARHATTAFALIKAVEEVRNKNEALRDAEQRFRSIAETAPDAVIIADGHGRIVFWNRQAEAMFGYAGDEVLGELLTVIMPVRYRQAHEAGLARFSSTGERRVVGRTVELIGLRKSGDEFPVELSLATWSRGNETLYSGILRDVTERKQLENQLRQSQKMEAIGQLAGGVAHDFNNLLTAILGYSEILLHSMPADDNCHDDLLEIQKAGTSAATLTRQLLAFSRKQVIEPTVLDLSATVASVGRLLKRVIGEDIELRLLLQQDVDLIMADRGQVEQILMNLAVNARDAMPSGGQLTIETGNVTLDEEFPRTHSGATSGPHVMLAVTDTGCGMTEDVQARVFEPFFTTKPAGQGTGLGLASVYGSVKQNQGSIWLYSEVGRGTTFKIYWPTTNEPVLPASVDRHQEHATGTETILVVEDDVAVRRLACRSLAQHGYTILTAADGQEALDISEATNSLDLLLTDVVLRGESGPQVAQRLLARRPGLRVLFMSGYTDETVVRHGLLGSDTAYLQKPFTPETLVRKVRAVLDARSPKSRGH